MAATHEPEQATAATPNGTDTALFQQLDQYPWDEDTEFQGGLRAILGSVEEPQQVEHLTLRAKCYYYARKAGTAVDFNGYKSWREQLGHEGGRQSAQTAIDTSAAAASLEANAAANTDAAGPAQPVDGASEPQRPASFAEICEMIAQGKPIPGIKDIPDTILEGQASERHTDSRKKPWERQPSIGSAPSWMP